LPRLGLATDVQLRDWQGDQIGRIFENYRSRPNFGELFATLKTMCKFLLKTGWATFWAIFKPGTDVMILNDFFKMAFFKIKLLLVFEKNIIKLVFDKKANFFRRKLARITENCDHNIDPSSSGHPGIIRARRGKNMNGPSCVNLRLVGSIPAYVNKGEGCKDFYNWVLDRVTRFGEFSPIDQLFTLGSYLKITEIAQIVGLCIFFSRKSYETLFQNARWSVCPVAQSIFL
jgi:hypothetical protein